MSGPMLRRIIVRGRVQGVGYRAYVAHAAHRWHIEGWVRNCRDGTVEAVLCGSPQDVTGVIAACRAGPAGARVDAIYEHDAAEGSLSLRRAGEAFSALATT
ncbi:MAG: acylphosphatase [Proteobacteria bacterium]|nr:acylphosphatase [Pseudomonadota bacterium]